MNDLIAVWCDVFLLGAVQNLPVLLAALLLDRLLVRLAWPGPRRWIWALVVIELLLPVAFGSPVHVAGSDAVAVPIDGATSSNVPFWLFAIWAFGAVFCALASLWSSRRAHRRLLRDTDPLPAALTKLIADAARRIGLRKTPRVRLSPHAVTPCVLGVLRMTVLIDVSLMAPSKRERLEHALLHEFGHISRRDPLRAWLVRGFACTWWFHPTAWFAARRFALLREVGCDALVARVLGARLAYCRTLATHAQDHSIPVALPALVRLPAEVLQRIAALRAHGRGPRVLRHFAAIFAAGVLLLCCVPLREHMPALPFSIPSIDDPGCLLRRYMVLGRMADPSIDVDPFPSPPNQEDR